MSIFEFPPLTDGQRRAFSTALDTLAQKLTEDERRLGIAFPYVTDASGAWQCMLASRSAGYDGEAWSHGNWFCGFWIGLLLVAHLHTGAAELRDIALERLQLVAQRQADPNTHDIGFIFLSSAVPAFHVTGNASHAEMAVAAATRLRARLVNTRRGSYLAAWGPLSDPRGRASAAIDTMANLRLLYWAGAHTGDASFTAAGEAHARMTEAAFIRADFSTFHAVEFDSESGDRRRGFTFQGYADTSLWSRGQAWAVLGFAETAAATGNPRYGDIAGRLADVFLARLADAAIAPWDFDDPAGARAPRDSAATAILANGLLTLAAHLADPVDRQRRFDQAVRLLLQLIEAALASESDHRGLLKHGAYSIPHGIGVDSAVLFGDYYFAEAISRLLIPGGLLAPLG